jgi:hypothetical protein
MFKRNLLIAVLAGAASGFLGGPVQAADNEVVMIPMTYSDGVYFRRDAPIEVLPCYGPNKPFSGDADDPVIEGYRNSERVFRTRLKDPRLKLVEDPTAEFPSGSLSSVDFTLYLPWQGEFTQVKFFGTVDQAKADAVIDLSTVVRTYRDSGGREQEAACQHPEELQASRNAIDDDAREDAALDQAESQ